MNKTLQLVNDLKFNGEDFEFYPTTRPMIDAVIGDLNDKAKFHSGRSINTLEIGAGDCRVSKALSEDSNNFSVYNSYVIEKAVTHIKNLGDDFVLVGTEFFETNLASIEAEIIFCNPPYSAYELWASNIITNSFASVVYLIIPERWVNSVMIQDALKQRKMTAKVIHSDDFLSADRQARAKINVLRVVHQSALINENSYYYSTGCEFTVGSNKDPLEDMLGHFDQFNEYDVGRDEIEAMKERAHEIFVSGGTVDDLVAFYNKDLEVIQKDFTAMCEVSPKVFRMLGVKRETLISTLKNDIKNLKYVYWQEFLNCYEPITSRLTSASREKIYGGLLSNVKKVDFTASNCYAMTVLAIEQANNYIDQQIMDMFFKHADEENLKAYKSNQKVFTKGRYRYRNAEQKLAEFQRCKLEYRMVCSYSYSSGWYSHDNERRMDSIINDYIVVAKTLGLFGNGSVIDGTLDVGNKIEVGYFVDFKLVDLFDIRFYKKGTYHVRLSQDFALRLNVAIAKLFGWVENAEQAAEELQEDLDAVKAVFNTVSHIGIEQVNFLAIGYNDKQSSSTDECNKTDLIEVCDKVENIELEPIDDKNAQLSMF